METISFINQINLNSLNRSIRTNMRHLREELKEAIDELFSAPYSNDSSSLASSVSKSSRGNTSNKTIQTFQSHQTDTNSSKQSSRKKKPKGSKSKGKGSKKGNKIVMKTQNHLQKPTLTHHPLFNQKHLSKVLSGKASTSALKRQHHWPSNNIATRYQTMIVKASTHQWSLHNQNTNHHILIGHSMPYWTTGRATAWEPQWDYYWWHFLCFL